MPNADETTVKLRAYADKAERIVPQNNLTEAQNNALELVNKTAQLEEEKKKSLEQIKIIEQLRESLQQEQVKTAEMVKMMTEQEARTKASAALEAKAKELAEALGKIAAIAAAVKTA